MPQVRFRFVLAILLLTVQFSEALMNQACLAQTHPDRVPKTMSDHAAVGEMKVEDTVVITLVPGADMKKVNAILREAGAEVYRTLKVRTENYAILFVRPKSGSAEDMQRKIEAMKDANFKAISRNRKIPRLGS